jgi:hypothetical protein
MSVYEYVRGLGLGLMATASLAAGASAAVLSETDAPGGAFGARWNVPTEVGAGITGITGTGSQGAFDNFVFTALPKGAQKITLEFSAPEGIGSSYSAGGRVLYGAEPVQWGWDGKELGKVQIGKSQPVAALSLLLDDGFDGQFYLALNFTHGKNLNYAIGVPSNALAQSPAAVPLPAGVLLIGTALGGLALLRTRRKPA